MNNREISLLYALAYIASDLRVHISAVINLLIKKGVFSNAEFSMEREGLQVTESTAVLRDVQELIRGIIHLTKKSRIGMNIPYTAGSVPASKIKTASRYLKATSCFGLVMATNRASCLFLFMTVAFGTKTLTAMITRWNLKTHSFMKSSGTSPRRTNNERISTAAIPHRRRLYPRRE